MMLCVKYLVWFVGKTLIVQRSSTTQLYLVTSLMRCLVTVELFLSSTVRKLHTSIWTRFEESRRTMTQTANGQTFSHRSSLSSLCKASSGLFIGKRQLVASVASITTQSYRTQDRIGVLTTEDVWTRSIQ